jgi:HAD superfamily hydrolase (TIGR01450 family)
MDSKTTFLLYENISTLPPKSSKLKTPLHVKDLFELTNHAKCFFLDAFGVLNVGDKPIKEALKFIEFLRKKSIAFLVLTNSASIPKTQLCHKLNKMGFDFSLDEIISSREVLWSLLPQTSKNWGVIGKNQKLEMPICAYFQDSCYFWDSDAFLFLSTSNWDESWQKKFRIELLKNPREVWVANPDLTAPRGNNIFSKEPGFYSLLEKNELFKSLHLVGKPYENIFSYAIKVAKKRWNIDKSEIIMVGDTLHTDILGANYAKIKSALIVKYGFFQGLDVSKYMAQSKIYPDFLIDK